jgi:phosphate:Na+ symporter
MDLFCFINLGGGIGLFLFGMHLMCGGLKKASKRTLQYVLEKVANNRLKGILLGAGVTAIIQSSSATTVMTVGLVDSEVIIFSEADSIIMGANIGTTATSWLLSFTGLQRENLLLNIISPNVISQLFATIGAVLIIFCKSSKKQNVGSVIMGLSLIFIGMNTINSAVAPLVNSPEFSSMLTMFNNPIGGLVAGTFLTSIIQSSSASVGILQALSLSNAITYNMAIPIVMGQNIGTCVTTIISGVGVNRNGKKVAFAHLCFNIIGALVLGTTFYGLNTMVQFPFLNQIVSPVGIAVIHTAFNVLSTMLMLIIDNGKLIIK